MTIEQYIFIEAIISISGTKIIGKTADTDTCLAPPRHGTRKRS